MHKDLYCVYIWSHETYRGWDKCIGDDASDKAIRIEVEVEVDVEVDIELDIGGWDT